MNIFADFNERVVKAVQGLGLKAKDGGALDLSRIAVEPPRDASHGDLATNAAMVLAKPAGQNPRALAETIAAALRADKDVVGVDVAGPGFVNLKLSDDFWQAHLAAILGEGTELRPLDDRRRHEDQCRICLGQPDRPDACRPLPRRRGWRRARQSARLRRLCGHQGICHQRRRRADRRARAFGHAALPRGARRRHRRDTRRPLSRRLPGPGRPGARRRFRPRPAADAGRRGARHRQGPHRRRHDGHDQGGPCPAQRPP